MSQAHVLLLYNRYLRWHIDLLVNTGDFFKVITKLFESNTDHRSYHQEY